MNEYKLKDLLTIYNGTTYSHLKEGDVPLYGSGGIMSYVNNWLYEGEAILLPRKGSLKNIMYINGKIWTVDTMYYAETKKEIDTYYLYSYLSLLNLDCLDSGSALPSMTKSAYGELSISLPDNDTQKIVGGFLKKIDTKIKLNNKINSELEKIARTLYDYWFVQFDFPDDNGKPYKSSGGEMVWNDELKREIPKGWEVKRISSKIKIGSGFPFKTEDYDDNGKYKIITIKSVQSGYLDINKADKIDFIPKNLPDFCKLNKGDVLMSLTGNVGRMCFVDQENLLLNQRVGKLLADRKFVQYGYLYFKRPENRIRLEKIANGSSQSNLSPVDTVKDYFVIPKEETLDSFSIRVNPIFDTLLKIQEENQKLAELRDWLLPMLMNGQITVN